jgi:hypothetical protein
MRSVAGRFHPSAGAESAALRIWGYIEELITSQTLVARIEQNRYIRDVKGRRSLAAVQPMEECAANIEGKDHR